MPFEVIYEDEDMLVVNKSAGVLSVPVPGSNGGNDVLSILRDHFGDSMSRGVFVVHRIDRFTSGILVFARNPAARRNLVSQFKNREPIREYLAVVRGDVKPKEGVMKDYLKPIAKSFRQIRGSKNDPGAALAELKYIVREASHDRAASLVSVWLKSGLKGQIRAQFEVRGNPLVGDRQYSSHEEQEALIDRQALHSYKLTVVHPRSKKEICCTANPPEDFMSVVDYFFGDTKIFDVAREVK
jgi:23S rRNA pseudouridine1911/1915/1917 synthase